MILKDPDPRHESPGRIRFQRNGKLEVREIDVSNPNKGTGNNLQELRLVWIVGPVRTMHGEEPRSTLPELERVKRVREPLRAPPASQTYGILDGCKYRFRVSWNFSGVAED